MCNVSLTFNTRQYQELHREQIRLLTEAHGASSQGFRARARLVTKENERRRRYTNKTVGISNFSNYFLCMHWWQRGGGLRG